MSDTSALLLSPELIAACKARRAKLRRAMADHEIDALLVVGEKDIRYLTGFADHDSMLLVTGDDGPSGAVIVSDPRYDEFLDPWRKAQVAEVVMGVRHRLANSIRDLCDARQIRRLGIQAEHVTIAQRNTLASVLGEQRLVETKGLISTLRLRKDALEIATIERAVACQQQALAAALKQLTPGMTEIEFCALLEYEMKSRGSSGASFPPIIGAGANSSIIHHATGRSPIGHGVLLVDWGALVDGYASDMTRTFGIGQMPDQIQTIYNIVLDAQLAAIDAIAPGKTCAEIDAVARELITKAGYGDRFGHGLGHGLGMDVHEEPYFNDLQTDVVLEPGMVMTVEPGIYLPGVGGVRIEDDVVVTESGARVLGDWPKDLASAVIEPALSGTR